MAAYGSICWDILAHADICYDTRSFLHDAELIMDKHSIHILTFKEEPGPFLSKSEALGMRTTGNSFLVVPCVRARVRTVWLPG